MVECNLAKVEVAGSNPVSRSNFDSLSGEKKRLTKVSLFFFTHLVLTNLFSDLPMLPPPDPSNL